MVNWIISSIVLIAGIIALRFFIKGKISLRLQYGLWAIVMLRLLIPISIGETAISVENWLKYSPQKEIDESFEATKVKLPEISNQQVHQETVAPYKNQGFDIGLIPEEELEEKVEYEIQEHVTEEFALEKIAKGIWITGSIVVGFWFLFVNIRFRQKVLRSRKAFSLETELITTDMNKHLEVSKGKLPIYLCDEVETPCLFGLIHPAIYVTSEVVKAEEVLRHVIAHETTHYLHRDYIWGCLRALCLTIHWYNPLVWCAAVLSRNDAELACDEAVIARLGEKERVSYGCTLIDLSCERHGAVLITATSMTGSRKMLKKRIVMLAKRKAMKRYMCIVVAVVVILCVGCTFTGANTEDEEKCTNLVTEADDTENQNTVIETITEMPEVLTEEELEQLRIELELRQQEVEQQRERSEKMAIFYKNMENGVLVTDVDIINRIRNLLQEENKFERMLNCEYDYDGTQDKYQISGNTVFLVEEASSWEYYEKMARKYYSESYIENEFTPFFLGIVYIEEDGKLYRTLADGIVNPILDSTIKVWQTKNGKYYVSVTEDSAGGNYLKGYVLDLSEDSIFGFAIVEKVQLLLVEEDASSIEETE